MFACWLYWSGTELLIASFLVEDILISANKITEGRGKEEGLIEFRPLRIVVGPRPGPAERRREEEEPRSAERARSPGAEGKGPAAAAANAKLAGAAVPLCARGRAAPLVAAQLPRRPREAAGRSSGLLSSVEAETL